MRELIERLELNEAINMQIYDFLVGWLKKQNIKPASTFGGALIVQASQAWGEKIENNMFWADKSSLKEFNVAYRKALKKVLGDDGVQALKDANKKIR